MELATLKFSKIVQTGFHLLCNTLLFCSRDPYLIIIVYIFLRHERFGKVYGNKVLETQHVGTAVHFWTIQTADLPFNRNTESLDGYNILLDREKNCFVWKHKTLADTLFVQTRGFRVIYFFWYLTYGSSLRKK